MARLDLIVTGDLYKHRTFLQEGSQIGINIRYFTVTAETNPLGNEGQLIDALDLQISPFYKALTSALVFYSGSDIQNISGVLPHPVQSGSQDNAGNGTAGASSLPSQASGIIKTVTRFTGRGFRGRSYVPFPPTNALDETTNPATPSAAYVTSLQGLATYCSGSQVVPALVGGFTTTIQWVLFHVRTLTYSDIVDGFAEKMFATQKRRGNFGRTNAPFGGV